MCPWLQVPHTTVQHVVFYITMAVPIAERFLQLLCALCADDGVTAAFSSQWLHCQYCPSVQLFYVFALCLWRVIDGGLHKWVLVLKMPHGRQCLSADSIQYAAAALTMHASC